jgi:uncharacterized protein YndB with AHSA1/START domain
VTAAVVVTRTVDVPVDPPAAFEVFTEEIDAWHGRGPYSWNDPERAVGIRFEPGIGGRWLEVWDEATGDGYEMGRILEWDPGVRLVLSFQNVYLPPEPRTEIEVRFDAIEGGTRVTLEHRGLDKLPPETLATFTRWAWIAFMKAFGDYVTSTKGR